MSRRFHEIHVHRSFTALRLGADADAFVDRLIAKTADGRPLKSGDRVRVVAVLAANRHWVVKRYRLPALKSILYHAVRRTPAWRELHGANRLAGLGVTCSRPLVLVHHSDSRESFQQTLVMPFVPGVPLSNWLRDQPPRSKWSATYRVQRLAMARWIGHQIGLLSRAGWINRDHKPANLMVNESCLAGIAPPVLIDTGSLRRRRSDNHVLEGVARFCRIAESCGTVTRRERMEVLRQLLATDPTLLSGTNARFRLRHALQRIQRRLGSKLPSPWRAAKDET